MLLNIYLVTTAISWGTVYLANAACKKKLVREGYKFVNKNRSFSENVLTFVSSALKKSIPVYNILNAITVILMEDKLYGYVEKKLLECGEIYKPNEEKLNSDSESQNLNQEKTDIYTVSAQKTKTGKTYEEMTTDEKLAYLQQEREKLTQVEMPPMSNEKIR